MMYLHTLWHYNIYIYVWWCICKFFLHNIVVGGKNSWNISRGGGELEYEGIESVTQIVKSGKSGNKDNMISKSIRPISERLSPASTSSTIRHDNNSTSDNLNKPRIDSIKTSRRILATSSVSSPLNSEILIAEMTQNQRFSESNELNGRPSRVSLAALEKLEEKNYDKYKSSSHQYNFISNNKPFSNDLPSERRFVEFFLFLWFFKKNY